MNNDSPWKAIKEGIRWMLAGLFMKWALQLIAPECSMKTIVLFSALAEEMNVKADEFEKRSARLRNR